MSRLALIVCICLCWVYRSSAQAPTATIVVPTATLCTGHTYNFTFTSTTTGSATIYNWAISPTFSVGFSPDMVSPSVDLSFGRPGVYTLSLTVSNGTNASTSSTSFSVNQNAQAAFNASLNAVGFPSQMILTNYSTNHLSSQWLYSDGPSDNTPSTVKDYTASGNYTISLVANGANGCNDTSSYSFRIADSSGVTVPNIFTPNNDSINDVFRPIARGITAMTVYIYDRFGTPIYSWNKPKGFWDGRNTSGEPLSAGVYFYVLEATGFDGTSYKKKGSITLLR